MPEQFHHIVPKPSQGTDLFEVHQLAYEFHRESAYRQERQNYCEWYSKVAQQHQQELEQMRQEFNIFRYFSSRK